MSRRRRRRVRLAGPEHHRKRAVLRVVGPVLLLVGGAFLAVGLVDFFSAFGGGGWPNLFWCCFVGAPLLGFGATITKLAYLGEIGRYIASEAAPVGKDTFNYLADGTRDGVETLSRAIRDGLRDEDPDAAPEARAPRMCSRCREENEPDASFCKACGEVFPTIGPRACGDCGEEVASDARFCDHCGSSLAS